MVSIMPSENTHFRVISSTDAMPTGTQQHEPVIVKPQPRTPLQPPQPLAAKSDLQDQQLQGQTSKSDSNIRQEDPKLQQHLQKAEAHTNTFDSDIPPFKLQSQKSKSESSTSKSYVHQTEPGRKVEVHMSKTEAHILKSRFSFSSPDSAGSVGGSRLPVFVPQAAARLLGDVGEISPECQTSKPDPSSKRRGN